MPRAVFPPILTLISDLTPGGAAAEGMLRAISGQWPTATGLAVLLAWSIMGFVVAGRTFRLEAP